MANIRNVEEIDGGDGYDTLQAGSGDDTIDLSAGPTLTGIDEIDGGYGNDHIIGTSGDDYIEGNRGDDILEGGGGNDTASGGQGDDTYVFDFDGSNDTFHGGSGWTDVIQLNADGMGHTDNPWTIEVDGQVVDYDLASHSLELAPDSSGTIISEDGSQLDFDGVDKIVW
jgi:Ca2+-binding RTX toxin-like protein